MKVLCLLLAFAAAAHAVSLENDKEWIGFKSLHSKVYSSRREEIKRRSIFNENKNMIDSLNAKDLGFTLEMNEFGDMSNEEFVGSRLGKTRSVGGAFKRAPAAFLFPENEDPKNLPSQIDWREHGYVTPVKDQGACGSCWSFSATGSLEGQHFRKTGQLVSLSEQNLVDCSTEEGDHGCSGGIMGDAFAYIAINGGIMSEADYPYKAVQGNCSYNHNRIAAEDVAYVQLPPMNETALFQAVATVGPVSVAIDASDPTFRFYKKGVYTSTKCSSTQLDHGVLAVGYGTENGQAYWLVKNSWNAGWGDQGYIKMSRNNNNNCGIASDPSYPIV